jgi:hypothetical protein
MNNLHEELTYSFMVAGHTKSKLYTSKLLKLSDLVTDN